MNIHHIISASAALVSPQQILEVRNHARYLLQALQQEQLTLLDKQNSINTDDLKVGFQNVSLTQIDMQHSQLYPKIVQNSPQKHVNIDHSQHLQLHPQQIKLRQMQLRAQLQTTERLKISNWLQHKRQKLAQLLEYKNTQLYNSHKRVILKQLLEHLRNKNEILQNMVQNKRKVEKQYEEIRSKTRHYQSEVSLQEGTKL